MNTVQSTHQFADAATSQIPGLRSHDCELIIRQGPENARVAVGKEKDRKPVDPPPIIQLKISHASDPGQNYLQSPYFFMSCSLVAQTDNGPPPGTPGTLGTSLAGTLVSSLHRLKDTDNNDGAFFVFGDLSVKFEGTFRLQFNLYEMRQETCFHIQACVSNPFPVHSTKNFPGMSESTFLTRSFSDQGVRLRLRKEPRTLLRKRGPAHDDYEPRHYRNAQRQSSIGAERQAVASPDSQDALRRTNNEQVEMMDSQTSIYDQRATGRQYSQQSGSSYHGSIGSIPYDDPLSSKRPRTGSEQGQPPVFGQQNQPLEAPQYGTRLYAEPQQTYSQYAQPQQASQPVNYSYGYAPPGQPSPLTSRDHYFSQKLGSQTGTTSPFDSTQSPQRQYFPSQPQGSRFTQQQYPSPLLPASAPQRIESTQHSFEAMGLTGGRGQVSPGFPGPGLANMAPPTYGRMNTNPTYAIPSAATPRRDSYQGYPIQSQNLSAGAMGPLYSNRSQSINTTTAPGTVDNSY